MSEKTLRLAHRHAKQSRRKPFTCFLVGTLGVDEGNYFVIYDTSDFNEQAE